MTYRIVKTDHFGGDYPDEKFVDVGDFVAKWQAQALADDLNERAGEHSSRYYKVVEMPYELAPGFEA